MKKYTKESIQKSPSTKLDHTWQDLVRAQQSTVVTIDIKCVHKLRVVLEEVPFGTPACHASGLIPRKSGT